MSQALCTIPAHLLPALPTGTSSWTKGKRRVTLQALRTNHRDCCRLERKWITPQRVKILSWRLKTIIQSSDSRKETSSLKSVSKGCVNLFSFYCQKSVVNQIPSCFLIQKPRSTNPVVEVPVELLTVQWLWPQQSPCPGSDWARG